MRTERIWIMAKPGEERFYTLPRPPTETHLEGLRKEGYQVFVTQVTFPAEFGVDAVELSPVELELNAGSPATIVVNGVGYPWLWISDGDTISYERVARMAKKKGTPTMTCQVGDRGFTLQPGETTAVEDGMSFDVDHTGNA